MTKTEKIRLQKIYEKIMNCKRFPKETRKHKFDSVLQESRKRFNHDSVFPYLVVFPNHKTYVFATDSRKALLKAHILRNKNKANCFSVFCATTLIKIYDRVFLKP